MQREAVAVRLPGHSHPTAPWCLETFPGQGNHTLAELTASLTWPGIKRRGRGAGELGPGTGHLLTPPGLVLSCRDGRK